MPECTFFQSYGKCSNPECLFRHIRPEDKIKPCDNYNMGFCALGPDCPKKHVRKVACPDYVAGFCYRGLKCKFAHPRWDTRILDRGSHEQRRYNLDQITCFRCGGKGHIAGSEACPMTREERANGY
eukprot:CAMPEP_0117448678 /NCGR_PEP_ID=MMETSP0759-20121206/7531_1 /TAXON_ID=63605 /ORGANISM="Percolomonas cosmopolitus, Strain WS" /LENGTH=125 /DNA_ID=CAMNT_0005241085 /DNA_START=270 /DNA_END=647 /DNA_ORIENTATION=+